MNERPLDLDAVRAFINVADLGSFTLAAEAMGATQSAVSLKLKRLEERLGCRLIERSPRHVQISARGEAFIGSAREMLAAHDRALATLSTARTRFVVGISDHVAGPEFPALIARINANDPQLLIEARVGSSGDLLKSYDRREIDAAFVRFHAGRDDGAILTDEKFGWYAAPGWHPRAGEPLPIATLAEPCGVRSLADRLLDDAGVDWTESFVGGGVAAVSAAVMAGLGVAAMSRRMLPLGAVDVGPRLGLPELPRLPIFLHVRVNQGPAREVLSSLSAALKGAVGD
ncbi:MAG: LysR substrate-binding domain-containing protein [Alphaproteobacteria bacterium]|nr:LysR substrate-binding domain-containing protein [Alphaproteobacteria bacterium]